MERSILAPLRNHTFFSLAELKRVIRRLLDELNDRPFQKLDGRVAPSSRAWSGPS